MPELIPFLAAAGGAAVGAKTVATIFQTRDDRWLASQNRRGRQVLLDADELLEPDPEVAELLDTHHVARPGAWAYGKRLVRPLPPRSAWRDDTNFSLVVESLNPAMEYRSHLADVLCVDKVVARLDFSGDPAFAELWARAARDSGQL
jgi:hypothetical protein